MHEFTIWAPLAKSMKVRLGEAETLPLGGPDEKGWWRLKVDHVHPGQEYAFLIDDEKTPYPDPRSMWQPQGVHGPSRLYDQRLFQWTDTTWHSPPLGSGVLYELHIGTFSEEGTFDGAVPHLDHLVELGVTHVAIMPIAEFAGDRGWGYDGVALFAVHEPYGGPDGLKRFVDACHAKNLAVVLDVVYNHFGPVGNYTNKFGPYLTENHRTPWGAAVNFYEGGSDEVRRFFCDNAQMWLREYHCDGLRLDAVHEFVDRSAVHFMEQLSAEVERLGAMMGRRFVLIAESDLNDPKIVRPREASGYGMDAQWSDDFHHSLFTLLWNEPGMGYYDDFGTLDNLVKSLKHAFVYDGEYSKYRKHSHGRPVENLSAHHFLGYDQNHDQVGNRAVGERIEHLIGMDAAKLTLGLTLMAPFIPMLFMGEEFASSSPFLYFADHEEEAMRKMVAEGRKKDFAAFGWDESQIPDPEAMETFERSKLIWSEVHEGKHEEMLVWTKKLIQLRKRTIDLNDGDFGHLKVECSEQDRCLIMKRGSIRVIANFGEQPVTTKLLTAESMQLASWKGSEDTAGEVTVPKFGLAILCAGQSEGTR